MKLRKRGMSLRLKLKKSTGLKLRITKPSYKSPPIEAREKYEVRYAVGSDEKTCGDCKVPFVYLAPTFVDETLRCLNCSVTFMLNHIEESRKAREVRKAGKKIEARDRRGHWEGNPRRFRGHPQHTKELVEIASLQIELLRLIKTQKAAGERTKEIAKEIRKRIVKAKELGITMRRV